MSRSLLLRILVVAAAGVLATAFARCRACDGRDALRVGTFNIRRFGVEPTDMARLTAIVGEAAPDVLALQEIQSVDGTRELARRLSRGGRSYTYVLSSCGGRSAMHVGFLYDETRVRLGKTREYPELDPSGGGACSSGERAGLAATFERKDHARAPSTFTLLAVHLVAGADEEKMARRREQWKRAHRIAAELGEEAPVAILGDTNSTGFLDDEGGERTFIEDEARRAGLDVTTRDLRCSEYFGPEGERLLPSMLDHVVATPSLARRGTVRVHGFCADLACTPTAKPPRDYLTVSDHCPVTVDLAE
jgi:endonuclease/exonuclease/phosphatase family metal-dependent hydrolase